MSSKVWDEITCPFPNFNSYTFEVWEWISHFIPHFVIDIITYAYWDLIKEAPDLNVITSLVTAEAHYDDVIMGAIASQITCLTIVYSTVYSGADQSKHQSSASLAFVWGIHRGPVNSPHKGPVTRKMFPFDDVIMHYNMYDTAWSLFAGAENQLLLKIIQENKTV